MGKNRNYGVELLRVLLMLFIILGHIFAHSGVRDLLPVFSGKWLITNAVQTITSCAVNCFIIITGYFSVGSTFSVKKLLTLWGKVLFYSVTIYAVLALSGVTPLSGSGLLTALLPVLRNEYWFFTSYILLYLLSPFLNRGLANLTDGECRRLAGITVVCFYILPVFAIVFPPFDETLGYGIIGFVTLYILGGYLHRFAVKLSVKRCLVLLLINNGVILLSKVVLEWIVERLGMSVGTSLLYRYNTVFQLANAVLLFLLFKQLSVSEKAGKWIAWLSGSVFSVYLIHEQPNMRALLWSDTLAKSLQESSVTGYMLICLAVILIVFAACVLIDRIRLLGCKALLKLPVICRTTERFCTFVQNKITLEK